MKIATGDLWLWPADARVITTNGTVKNDGACVMGRGCALQAKEKYPILPFILGAFIREKGNHVHPLIAVETDAAGEPVPLISFPVKNHWAEKADYDLIVRSAAELVKLVDERRLKHVVMPRPGCGNGQLEWRRVAPLIEFLDDRFTVIDFPKGRR